MYYSSYRYDESGRMLSTVKFLAKRSVVECGLVAMLGALYGSAGVKIGLLSLAALVVVFFTLRPLKDFERRLFETHGLSAVSVRLYVIMSHLVVTAVLYYFLFKWEGLMLGGYLVGSAVILFTSWLIYQFDKRRFDKEEWKREWGYCYEDLKGMAGFIGVVCLCGLAYGAGTGLAAVFFRSLVSVFKRICT